MVADPFSTSISADQRKKILERAIRQSERWRLGKEDGLSDSEIRAQFDRKTKMQVWSWRGQRDTVMTPLDSIRYMKGILRSGFVAMNPHNGHVLAYVGDINFSQFQYDMVSDGRRQTGSIIKPLPLLSGDDRRGFSLRPGTPRTAYLPPRQWANLDST